MNLFSYIKSHISIFNVVNEYTTLKKAGLYWKSNCPFHAEKTASFTVSPHKEIFYCFGCHAGGDVITFVSKMENCSPLESAKLLIDRYKLSIPQELQTQDVMVSGHEKNRYFDLCSSVASWMHSALLKDHAALEYLSKRGIAKQIITSFNIGYFPGGPNSIKNLLSSIQKEGFLANDLIQANILAVGKTVLYSPFEERIIFPIKDHLGRSCGFGGRVFKPTDERAKYYNSRESSHFNKGSLLFGLDMAKHEIQKKEAAFLVEGYTDCIAMVQHGYANTVATLGTACTLEHLTSLSRYANTLYILYDGDHAGQEAILRLTQLCWQVNLELSVIPLSSNDDPASLLAKGNDLSALIANPVDIFTFYITSLGKDFKQKTLQEKLQLAQKITAIIQRIDSTLKRDILLQKAAETLDIPFASLKQTLKPEKQQPLPTMTSQPNPSPEIDQLRLEKKLFFAIIHNIQIFNRQNEEYLIEYLPHPFKEILVKLQHAKDVNIAIDFTQFFDMLTTHEQQCVSKIVLEYEHEASTTDFDQLLLQFQKKHWKQIVHTTTLKLAQAEQNADTATIEKILHSFLELKKKMFHTLGNGNQTYEKTK